MRRFQSHFLVIILVILLASNECGFTTGRTTQQTSQEQDKKVWDSVANVLQEPREKGEIELNTSPPASGIRRAGIFRKLMSLGNGLLNTGILPGDIVGWNGDLGFGLGDKVRDIGKAGILGLTLTSLSPFSGIGAPENSLNPGLELTSSRHYAYNSESQLPNTDAVLSYSQQTNSEMPTMPTSVSSPQSVNQFGLGLSNLLNLGNSLDSGYTPSSTPGSYLDALGSFAKKFAQFEQALDPNKYRSAVKQEFFQGPGYQMQQAPYQYNREAGDFLIRPSYKEPNEARREKELEILETLQKLNVYSYPHNSPSQESNNITNLTAEPKVNVNHVDATTQDNELPSFMTQLPHNWSVPSQNFQANDSDFLKSPLADKNVAPTPVTRPTENVGRGFPEALQPVPSPPGKSDSHVSSVVGPSMIPHFSALPENGSNLEEISANDPSAHNYAHNGLPGQNISDNHSSFNEAHTILQPSGDAMTQDDEFASMHVNYQAPGVPNIPTTSRTSFSAYENSLTSTLRPTEELLPVISIIRLGTRDTDKSEVTELTIELEKGRWEGQLGKGLFYGRSEISNMDSNQKSGALPANISSKNLDTQSEISRREQLPYSFEVKAEKDIGLNLEDFIESRPIMPLRISPTLQQLYSTTIEILDGLKAQRHVDLVEGPINNLRDKTLESNNEALHGEAHTLRIAKAAETGEGNGLAVKATNDQGLAAPTTNDSRKKEIESAPFRENIRYDVAYSPTIRTEFRGLAHAEKSLEKLPRTVDKASNLDSCSGFNERLSDYLNSKELTTADAAMSSPRTLGVEILNTFKPETLQLRCNFHNDTIQSHNENGKLTNIIVNTKRKNSKGPVYINDIIEAKWHNNLKESVPWSHAEHNMNAELVSPPGINLEHENYDPFNSGDLLVITRDLGSGRDITSSEVSLNCPEDDDKQMSVERHYLAAVVSRARHTEVAAIACPIRQSCPKNSKNVYNAARGQKYSFHEPKSAYDIASHDHENDFPLVHNEEKDLANMIAMNKGTKYSADDDESKYTIKGKASNVIYLGADVQNGIPESSIDNTSSRAQREVNTGILQIGKAGQSQEDALYELTEKHTQADFPSMQGITRDANICEHPSNAWGFVGTNTKLRIFREPMYKRATIRDAMTTKLLQSTEGSKADFGLLEFLCEEPGFHEKQLIVQFEELGVDGSPRVRSSNCTVNHVCVDLPEVRCRSAEYVRSMQVGEKWQMNLSLLEDNELFYLAPVKNRAYFREVQVRIETGPGTDLGISTTSEDLEQLTLQCEKTGFSIINISITPFVADGSIAGVGAICPIVQGRECMTGDANSFFLMNGNSRSLGQMKRAVRVRNSRENSPTTEDTIFWII